MKKKSILLLGLATLAMSFGTLAAVGGANISNENPLLVKAADEESKDIALTFSKATNSKGVSAYDATWSVKTADGAYQFSLYGFNNNNNGWNSVKCGSKKNGAYIATITSSKALSIPVAKVVLTLGSVTSANVNSVYLETSSDEKTWENKISLPKSDVKTGDATFAVSSPTSNLFYRISVDCNAGSNGFFELTKVLFVAGEESTDPSVAIDGEADITLKTGEMVELPLKTKNLPEGATLEVSTEDEDVAVAEIKEDKSGIDIMAGDKAGQTTYKVIAKSSGEEIASCTGTITVSVAPTSVTVTGLEDNAALKLGSSVQLSAAVAPETCSQEVTWTVSDASVASISGAGLLTINQYGSKEGGYTVTAASKADSSVLKTLHFTINNEFAISELVSLDGKNYQGNLKEGMVVSTVGTVSAIESKNVFIQSNGYGLMLFTYSTTLSSLKVGDGIKASGALSIYNGMMELTSPTFTKDDSVKEDIIPAEITAENLPDYKLVGSLMSAKGAVCQASKAVSGTKDISVSFRLADGKTSFTLFIKKAMITELSKTFGNFEKDVAYDLIGVKQNYNGNMQLVIDQGCSYYKVGAKEVQTFIAENITPYKGAPAEGDTCRAKAQRALDAYNAMSEEAKKLFNEDSAYADDKAIYDYWLANSGISAKLNLNNAPFGPKTTNWTSTGTAAIVSIAAVALALGGVLLFVKKHD